MYRSMRFAASMMSSIRSRHSLGGKDGLAQDLLPQMVFQATGSDEVDRLVEQVFKVQLKFDQVEQSDRLGKLDQQIDIAISRHFVPGDWAE